MLLRTFVVYGIMSILQACFGHRYPIIDGPSGMWLTVGLSLANVVSAMHGDLSLFRTHIVFGMLISGAIVIVFGLSGCMKYITWLFTPLVSGVFLILMPIQLSRSFVGGMFGIVYGGSEIDTKSFIAFWITVIVLILVNVFGSPFLKSIAILIGIAIGWVFAVIIGIGDFGDMSNMTSFIVLPQVFAWGAPVFDPGILITCVIGSFLLFVNVIASLFGMADALEEDFSNKQLNRGTMFVGVSAVMTGIFPTIGFVPFTTSIGIVRMTSVATRKPFYIGSAVLIILGILGPVGLFFAAIPPSVGYGAMTVLFAVIVKQGVDFLKKAELTERKGLVLGISLLTGTGIMMQPFPLFENLPAFIIPFASNGLLVGMILAIILDQVMKEKPALQ
jgi:xanthine/uracil permease